MKISTNSWHYKFLKLAGWGMYDMPDNLCRYFWTVVLLAPAKVIGILFLVLIFIFIIIGLPILLAIDLFFPILDHDTFKFACFIITVEIGLLIWRAGYLIKEKLPSMPKHKPGLLEEFIKAKKQKLCPILKFID